MKISITSPLVFKYIALPHGIGGRGGVQRFFLLSQKIPFEEKLIPYTADWAAEKKRLVSSGENPSGTVPIIYAKDSDDNENTISMPQHIASSRFLARVYGVTSGDAYKDYVQDLVADEYQGFRNEWVQVSFSGSDDDKADYRNTKLSALLTKFDALYDSFKTHETYLSVSASTQQPLWGDAAIFGLLRDHILTGHITKDDLKAYSNLHSMFEEYESIPAVSAWIGVATSNEEKKED